MMAREVTWKFESPIKRYPAGHALPASGDKAAKMVIVEASYETTDPTVDSTSARASSET